MCRFHSKEVYRQPILDGLDYLWRLDDDSELSHPFSYDIFKFMQDNNYSYGYYYRVMDPCVELLWEASCKYVYCELCIVYSVFCTVYCVLCIVHCK